MTITGRGGERDPGGGGFGFAFADQVPPRVNGDPGRESEEREGDQPQGQPFAASGSLERNCQISTSAEDTSTNESRPNPTSAVDDAARCDGDDAFGEVVAGSRVRQPPAARVEDRAPLGREGRGGHLDESAP
jgi:hypothetical protein